MDGGGIDRWRRDWRAELGFMDGGRIGVVEQGLVGGGGIGEWSSDWCVEKEKD